jgi:cation diffusion facilitator CzcD-associated flavoprotein CzcO
MICTGHHHTESWPSPTFPGQDHFKGKLLHSRAFHTAKPFEDQNVVVVGIGNVGDVHFGEILKQLKF